MKDTIATWNDFLLRTTFYSCDAIPDAVDKATQRDLGLMASQIRISFIRHAVMKQVGAIATNLLGRYRAERLGIGGILNNGLRNDISGLAFWLATFQREKWIELEREPHGYRTHEMKLESAWIAFGQQLGFIFYDDINASTFMSILNCLYAVMRAAGEEPPDYFKRSLLAWKTASRSISEYDT